jgi:uncharacterized protein (TIGR03086 family)
VIDAAAAYLVDSLEQVRPDDLDAPTPCTEWTVCDLLVHLGDATAALLEAADGVVTDEPRFGGSVLARARLLAAGGVPPGPVQVGDRVLDGDLLDAAGALELAVHGWDLGTALRRTSPIPENLARQLLVVCAALPVDRPEFAPAITPPLAATAAQRLLNFLGRNNHAELAP